MHRCLFTDTVSATPFAVEHSPPRSFGGGFPSRSSVSTEFNNTCGHSLDADLEECWFDVTSRLGPTMPSGGSSRTSTATVEGVAFVLGPGGSVSNRAPVVTRRDDGSGISQIIAPTSKMIEQVARQDPGLAGKPVYAAAPTLKGKTLPVTRTTLTPAAEIGALRHLLVVMDTVHDHAADSWVRSSVSARPRELVRRIAGGGDLSGLGAVEILRGLDYGLAGPIRAFAERVAEAQGVRLGDFEHVFLAEGDPTTRLVNAAWLFFGAEPMKFQLAHEYTGPHFTAIAGVDPCSARPRWSQLTARPSNLRWGPRGASSVLAVGNFGDPAHRALVGRQRMLLMSRADAWATIAAPAAESAGMANYFLHCVEHLGGPPRDIRALLLERLTPAYREREVEQALSALSAELPVGRVIGDTPRWLMHALPDWAAEAGDCYVRVVRWLYERGVYGELSKELSASVLTTDDLGTHTARLKGRSPRA